MCAFDLFFHAVYIDIYYNTIIIEKGGIVMEKKEGNNIDELIRKRAQKEKNQLEAFSAGYAFACYGEVRLYNPRYQYFWERGYRVGRFISSK